MTCPNRSKLLLTVAVAACIVTAPTALTAEAAAVARPGSTPSVQSLSAGDLLLGWWNTLVSLATGAGAPAPAGARIDGNGASETLGTLPEVPFDEAGARIDGNGAR